MPYASQQQRKMFNARCASQGGKWCKLAAEYNRASKGKRLPQRAPKRK